MMKVTANGKTFTFPDGTSTEDIGTAIDEYFAGQAVQQQTVNQANNAPTREEPSLMQQAGDWLTGGQSAGQIAEQAGRGLVNIPFDVLQGGASLINAISQGLGGPKVLDDVYRPVDRPTDPYAQAGETIGGYLVPGVGTAGSMAIGSLAEAANQKGDFAQNATKNAGVNLAAQGVLSAAAKGIGRGITAVRGEISPADQQLLKRAAAADVPVMTSDVVPPKTKLGNQLQGYSEGVIAGTGPMRAAQQDARTKLVNRFTEKYGDYDPSVVVDSLKSGVAREKSLAKSKLNNLSGRMVGKPVDTSGAIRAIDGAVNELGKLKGVSDTQTISALNDYKNAIQEITNGDDAFELLDKLRTQFRIDVKGDRTVLPSMSQTMVDRVYNSLTNSLSKSIAKGLSPKDASAWRAGKADYAKMATHATQTRLKNVLNKGDLTPEAVNTIVYGQYGSDIARLYGKLDQKGKDMLRAAYISKIADKVGDSPQKMMTELGKLQKQANGQVFKTVFGGKNGKEIEGMLSILDATKRASEANVVTKTGMTLAPLVRVIGNLKTGGALLAGETGIGLMSRVYESPMARNALLRLANTKAGTPAYERALNNAANAIRPILANDATDR
ncbi:TPA: DNA transfer protein [Escherichia coli]|uniref:DNA transfer protein n=2 Tax=Enterobacterales TaxID=91347 RepID=A0A5U6D2X2_SALER|nr:DNA transfer protein [Salmonella enterica]EAM7840797.1 DNA transfer protein [Salmonella enterica subsp. enterica]EAO4963916.1 DNA transfer protein [Salmonella enterica subsp. enterica serovar Ohio]EAY3079807.1 DNA transfer protein [Salmonella enterica subsp. enterica serovar Typhimurium]ECB8053101.1 DNA transfer protein [Salmonella enterica subsp. enterica serovar Hadar]ECT0721311.1 DNA transfer protein [Salmonella enterica subsp. enterica serovar Anatum]ECU0461719.1 DNA transfer protein [